ncbi:MAG TPA: hypothetical protein VM099_11030 [Gemmatimonadaceae bacterium]|nr:hypothetical protein [Gemmatimonadaceae bacterium]
MVSRPSRLAAVAAVPFLLAARPLAAPMAGGTTYEFVVRSTSTASGDKESVMMRGRGTFAGTDGRIDILEAGSQSGGSETFGGKGSYFLVLDGGKKMMLVDPSNKQYMQWDMASMLAGMSKMVNAVGGLVHMEMSEIKIDAQDLGAGETIQGYSTRHFRMTQNYSISAKMFGRTSKSRSESTTDYYFAPALKALSNPFMSNSQAWAASFDMFNNPDYKSQMQAAQSKIQFGVPVKSVVRTVTTDEKGKQQVSVVTSEMINFKNTDVPSSTFAIPASYKMVEMPKMDMSASATSNSSSSASADINADSIANAAKEGAKEGVKEGVKEGAKEATAKKLRGIFKR